MLLERPADARSLDGTSKAAVKLLRDQGDQLRISVDAGGSGYLVVADSLRAGGWTASVDGRAVALVAADEAMSAVYVASGRHIVELTYAAPGLRAGAVISAVSILVLMVGVCSAVIRRRSRRQERAAEAEV